MNTVTLGIVCELTPEAAAELPHLSKSIALPVWSGMPYPAIGDTVMLPTMDSLVFSVKGRGFQYQPTGLAISLILDLVHRESSTPKLRVI